MITRNVQGALAGLILIIVAAHTGWGQTADLSGIIKDKSGAVIPNAAVSVLNEDTGTIRKATTDGQGVYIVPLLNPGPYKMTIHAIGFQPLARTGIMLYVGDRFALDFVLDVGEISTEVTVTAEGPQLMQAASSVGTVIDRQFVANLPLNGRSFQSLILLTPGVTMTPASTLDYGQFSVNGQRASTNYFTIDGVSSNIGMATYQGGAVAGTMAGAFPGLSALGGTNNLVSADALEEFKIQTSTTAAEFGRQPGGQISLVTRSGSNLFHGTLFEYLRNDLFDATDWFVNAKGLQKAPLRANQFGGTFSGPILKNKTFFFFSYEGQRLRLPVTGIVNVPSLRVRNAAAASVQPILNSFPIPTGPELLNTSGVPTGWAQSRYNFSNPSTLDATSIRIDHTLYSKHNLFGRFNDSPSNATTFSGGANGTANNVATRTLTVGATSALTQRLINELRFNFSRSLGNFQYVPANYGGAVPLDPSVIQGLSGYGSASFMFGGSTAVVSGGDQTKNYQRQWNIVDSASLVNGTHLFKFGIDYRRLSPTYAVRPSQFMVFSSEAAVINATVSASITNNLAAHPTYANYSPYGQDTWKVMPRLTLDYGLRWELNPAPTLADGELMPAVVTGVTSTDVSKATLAPPGSPFYKTFYTAFAPRFGAAYQLNTTGGRETVLRGGFGVFYDLGSAGPGQTFPLRASKSLPAGTPFPLSATNATLPTVTVPTSTPVTVTVTSSNQDLKLPYTLQWNVAVEQSLGRQQSVSLSYVGSAGRRLLTTQFANGRAGNTTGPRPNPDFSTIVYTWNEPTSDYNAMQVQYKARFHRGLQALVNYTWSHAIDVTSDDTQTYSLSRGNADFDVRHNMSAAFNYDIPAFTAAPLAKHLLSNWSMDGIVHAQTGRPVGIFSSGTVMIEGVALQVRPDVVPGEPWYLYDKTVAGGRLFNAAAFNVPQTDPAYPNVYKQGNFGRNVLRELSLYQVDLAFGRRFHLTEKHGLQFKCEMFNIFNHPMFGDYGSNFAVPSTFGVPTTMLRTGLSASNGSAGLNPLFQIGGPRSVQFSLRLTYGSSR